MAMFWCAERHRVARLQYEEQLLCCYSPSAKGDDMSREGLCLLDGDTLRTCYLSSGADAVSARTGWVEMCLEGLPPSGLGPDTPLRPQYSPAMPTVTMVHRQGKDSDKNKNARLSVYGVAPEAALSSKQV